MREKMTAVNKNLRHLVQNARKILLKRIRSLGKQLVSIDMIFTTENQQCMIGEHMEGKNAWTRDD